MKQFTFLLLSAMVLSTTACNHAGKTGKGASSNPLLSASTLPFQAPPFDKIKDSDFEPAMDSGMKAQLMEIQQIADNPDTPTFKNTFIPLEKSGRLLDRVQGVFNLLTSANTNPSLQKVQETEAPKLAANHDAIYLNKKLFERIQSIYHKRSSLNLDSESLRLVGYYYQKFILAGANLSDGDKAKLKSLNEEEASLSAKFTNQLLAATKAGALVVSDTSELAGLSEGQLDAAAAAAKSRKLAGKWVLP
ncbi:MAG TPA: dipeptidyl carboxypeptidase II, partial [Chitinophagaceae bacterium]|nr:dipeptidyl carboxypeptidase II [Chitinophagaceae bacterium]